MRLNHLNESLARKINIIQDICTLIKLLFSCHVFRIMSNKFVEVLDKLELETNTRTIDQEFISSINL